MSSVVNTCVVLAQRPDGMPTDECWTVEQRAVEPVDEGLVLVDIESISIDPAMRAWMNEHCVSG